MLSDEELQNAKARFEHTGQLLIKIMQGGTTNLDASELRDVFVAGASLLQHINAQQQEIERLRAENERLGSAFKFYATAENWQDDEPPTPAAG